MRPELKSAPQAYALEIGTGTLAEIETVVEKLKRNSLPEIEHQLLVHDQAELVKKSELSRKGTTRVEFKTIHG